MPSATNGRAGFLSQSCFISMLYKYPSSECGKAQNKRLSWIWVSCLDIITIHLLFFSVSVKASEDAFIEFMVKTVPLYIYASRSVNLFIKRNSLYQPKICTLNWCRWSIRKGRRSIFLDCATVELHPQTRTNIPLFRVHPDILSDDWLW